MQNFQTNRPPVNMKKVGRTAVILTVLLAAVILFFAFSPFVTVPAGHSGVVVTMGRVSDTVLPDGLHFKLPWQNVILIDNRAQKVTIATQAFSADIQQVDITASVNYSIDRETSNKLYKTVGTTYYETVMKPRLMENTKSVFSKYSAENLVAERESLSRQVMDLLVPEMKAYGIEVLSIAIEDIDFTDAFTNAVEDKQVAEQTLLKTKIEQEEKLLVEEAAAKRIVITANADAEVARINADAKAYAQRVSSEAEAAANKLIAGSITPHLIQYVQANGWDGKLPQFFGGEGMLPFLNFDANELTK